MLLKSVVITTEYSNVVKKEDVFGPVFYQNITAYLLSEFERIRLLLLLAVCRHRCGIRVVLKVAIRPDYQGCFNKTQMKLKK